MEIGIGSKVQVSKAEDGKFKPLGDATVLYPPEVGGSCAWEYENQDCWVRTSQVQSVD